MFTIYVLRSLRNSRRYVGFTSRPVEARLSERNRGYPKGWTSRNRPFELVMTEEFRSERDARAREQFLQSGAGREWLNETPAGYPPPAGGAS
ncbi:MAG: GIY-YIG nuclease family protein [Chloroflexi bacterium]|nr:GIY-YIG nuclease family protein [Chloroflexota bacterium]